MSDDIDEWALELRLAIDRAKAAGVTEMTLTASTNAMQVIADSVQMYFREEDVERCFVCDMRRNRDARLKAPIQIGRNPNWRRDAKPRARKGDVE
jgi:hypothetical protein